jgi:hypothetical protein
MTAHAKRIVAYVLVAALVLAVGGVLFGNQIEVVAASAPLAKGTEAGIKATGPEATIPDSSDRPCVQIGEKLACLRSRADVQASREKAPVLGAASQVFTLFSRSLKTPVFAAETINDPDGTPGEGNGRGDEDGDRDDDVDNDWDDDEEDTRGSDEDDDDDDDRDDARGKKPKKDKRPKKDKEKKPKCNQGVGNGPEGCDPGNSNRNRPSNDEEGGTPGNPGRRGGAKWVKDGSRKPGQDD